MPKIKISYVILSLCVLWTAFILFNSTLSALVSDKQSEIFIESTEKILSVADAPVIAVPSSNTVRKLAHVFEYIVQAFLLSMMFLHFKLKIKDFAVSVFFIGLLTAVTDEGIQLFSPGRGSSVADVLLDFFGALIGFGLLCLIYQTYKAIRSGRLRRSP